MAVRTPHQHPVLHTAGAPRLLALLLAALLAGCLSSINRAPLAPEGVTARAGNGQVTVSWNFSDSANSYNLYWGTSDTVSRTSGTQVTDVTSPYTVTGLSNGTTYYFVVTAVNGQGEGPESAVASAAPSGPPTVVSTSPSSGATNVSPSTTVSVTFSQAMDKASTEGAFSINPNVAGSKSWSQNDTVLTFTPASSLSQGTTYTVTVTTAAKDSNGRSLSSQSSFNFTAAAAVSTPGTLSAAAGNGQVTLTWTAPSSGGTPDGYHIYRSTSSGVSATGTPYDSVTPATTVTYTDIQATNGTTYYYVVAAYNSVGTGAASNEASATPVAVPGAPTDLTAAAENGQVVLTWTAPTSGGTPSSYSIYRSTTSPVDTAGTAHSSTSSTSYADSASNGTTYCYRVVAVGTTGNSPDSNEVCATPHVLQLGPPRGVAATAGIGQVTVTWDAVGGASGYTVYSSNTPGTGTSGTAHTGATSPYTLTGLTNGTTTYFVVTATTGAGTSVASAEVGATPQATSTTVPQGVAVAAGDGQVVVSWNAVSGADTYNLYYSTSSTLGPSTLSPSGTVKIAGVASPYVFKGLANGSASYFLVAPVTGTTEGTASYKVSATPKAPAPDAPLDLAATATGGSSIRLTWAAPATGGTPTGYQVFRSTSPGVSTSGTGSLLASVTGTSFTDTRATASGTYHYRVVAYDASGNGPDSSEASAQAGVPSAPSDLAATPGDSQVTLTWSSVIGATSYNVYYGTTSGSTTNQITGVSSPFTHTILVTNGTHYYYTVTAQNSAGESSKSREVGGTPNAAATGAPTGVTATAADGQNTISWTAVAGATSYKLYRSNSSGLTTSTGTVVTTCTSTSTTCTDTGRTNGTPYYYIVTAVTSGGEGAASNEVNATPQGSVPAAPASLTATAGDGTVTLSWAAVSGATSYKLYRSNSSGLTTSTGTVVTTCTSTSTSCTDTGRTDNTPLYYIVTAVNSRGAGPASPEAMATPQRLWTWESGSTTVNAPGVYSGTAVPGARDGAVSWADGSGNLWLFGGQGRDSVGSTGYLNDLWKYTSSTWVSMSGSSTVNATGVYTGTSVPGARQGAVSWTDASGNLWLFGGYGYASSGSAGYLNDLWEYSGGSWTWKSGSTATGSSGTYGSSTGTTGLPSARSGAVSWVDSSGNLWLFGGYGDNSAGTLGYLNDLWKYASGTNQWTWVAGSKTANAAAVYGTQGTAAAGNVPSARQGAAGWIDSSNNLWLFGGAGSASVGSGYLNDLWKFDGSNWTWVSGQNDANRSGVYGSQFVAASANLPGGRLGASAWRDSSGNLWLFGGQGRDSAGNFGSLSDLWKYSPSAGNWMWVSGSSTAGSKGIYGTKGTADIANRPGAREGAAAWLDSANHLVLFGGNGYDSAGSTGRLNDLWQFGPVP